MTDKRKGAPDGAGPNNKRKKAGNKGKWTTTHQTERVATKAESWGPLTPLGKAGIWITCARGMERKAGKEVDVLYQRYAKTMYGIDEGADGGGGDGGADAQTGADADTDDIAAMVQKEIDAMKKGPAPSSRHIVRYDMGLTCVGFTCLKYPLDPVAMVEQICADTKREADAAAAAEEAAIRTGQPATPTVRSCKYVNRLTPVTTTGKATRLGIKKTSRHVLSKHFKLVPVAADKADDDEDAEAEAETEAEAEAEVEANEDAAETADTEKPQHSFSIRANIRRHDGLETRALVDQVAQLIDQDHHKANLTSPDKVILVEVFKNSIGLSVVDGAWEKELRKFNITAIYNQARTDAAAAWDAKHEADKAAGESSADQVEATSKADTAGATAATTIEA